MPDTPTVTDNCGNQPLAQTVATNHVTVSVSASE